MGLDQALRPSAVIDGLLPETGASARAVARAGEHWWLLFVALTAAIICLPFARAVLWLGDQDVLLHGADRMLSGERLYVDFFEFLPPGGFLLTAGWLHAFGISLLAAQALAILCFVAIACFTFLVSQKLSKSIWLSVALVIAWLVMSQGAWTTVNHHWLSTMFCMVAFWAALGDSDHRLLRFGWPFIAGMSAAVAAMIVTHQGVAAALAAAVTIFSTRRNIGKLCAFSLGVTIVLVFAMVYLAITQSLQVCFYDVILFPLQGYAPIQHVPYGNLADIRNYPLVAVFPLAAILSLLVCGNCSPYRTVATCSAVEWAARTKRRTSSTDAWFALAVLTTERKAA